MVRPPPGRILVVDDNEALRENLQEALELEGYDVTVAADGVTALAHLERDPTIRVVLLDLVMPGMDGRELLAAIRSNPRLSAVRVVLTTGHSGPRVRAAVPADAFLTKPFGVVELLAAVAKAAGLVEAASPTQRGGER